MTKDLRNITLKSDRLRLRPVTLDDADWIAVRSNDYDIAKMTLSIPYPQTRANVLRFIHEWVSQAQAGTDYIFSIFNTQPCGLIGLNDTVNGTAEIGYWLSRKSWGHGLATEAVKTIADFGFETLKLKQITAGHFIDNAASARVLEKTGFHYTGEICNLVSTARKSTVQCKQMVLKRAPWREQATH